VTPVSATESGSLPQAVMVRATDASLAMAQSLRARGVRVIILTDRGWIAATRRAETHLLGSLPEAADGWLERLEEIGSRGDGVLISGSDRATEFLSSERTRIPERLLSFERPGNSHLELMDKGALYGIAERAGVRFPRTLRLSVPEELERVAEQATFPCLIKPAISHLWRRLFGDRRVLPVCDRDQLLERVGPALDAGLELLVTEEIPGPDHNLEGAVTVRMSDGSYALRYGRRKLRQYPLGYGGGSLVESAMVPETMDLADRLLSTAGFVGVSSLESKRHAETGERVLIEVNVRIPQNYALGDACGADASWRVYAALAGLRLPPQPDPVEDIRVMVPSLETRAAVSSLYQGRATVRELLASYRGVRYFSGLSVRDPGPLLRLGARQFRALVRFLLGRRPPTESVE